MFKLQVVLVPAGANRSFNFGLPSVSSESSQFILPGQQQVLQQGGNAPQLANSIPAQNGIGALDPNVSTNTAYLSSFMTSHITRPKLKKFLIFTKPTNTLYQLSQEILDKCNKIYPNLSTELEIDTLQDVDECDLDPDFVVKDVFNVYNTVRVILRNDVDLESNPDRQESLYSSKRRKLNNGNSQQNTSTGATLDQPVTVAKRRPQALKNSALRISTPLAHQIYPPPSQRNPKQVNSDYEEDEYGDDEIGDKSILPPPTVPQSPPIRISSSIAQKRLKINGSEDTVSKSETVDPSKAKQQRLPSGTPMKPMNVIETPNRPGFLAMPQQAQHLLRINSTPVVTNKRITSGMLRIPEPRISEMERTMHEGLSSPAAGLLPPKSAKIPMKKQYIPDERDSSSSEGEFTEDKESVPVRVNSKAPLPVSVQSRAPSSIADDNGSPTKKSPLDATKRMDVKVADLPPQRKSSLEAKVEKLAKNASELVADNHLSSNTTRKEGFSESESENAESENEANDTVCIHPTDRMDGSFQKSELLELLKGSKFDVPPAFRRAAGALQENDINKRSRKPYLTVLNKDIDNSEPDPRNILPSKLPRQAAQKAAQFISTGTSRRPLQSSSSSSSSSVVVSEESSSDSDIETENSDNSMDEVNLKRLNVHPLRPVMVPVEETQDTNELGKTNLANSSSSSSEESESADEPRNEEGKAAGSENPQKSESKVDQVESVSQPVKVTSSRLITLKPVDTAKEVTPSPSMQLHEKIDRQLSPSPTRNKKDYISPEFIEDSDDDAENGNITLSQRSQNNKENTEPSFNKENSEDIKLKKITPSALKKKQEAEQRRLQREAARKAKEEEKERRRAEREAARRAKQEEQERKRAEREAAKRARQEEIARKKAESTTKKGPKETKKNGDITPKVIERVETESSANGTPAKKAAESGDQSPDSPSRASKLDELRNKFAVGKASITGPPKKAINKPIKLQLSSASTSNTSSDSDGSSDSESSTSSENETSMTKKTRRGIVDTPKGLIGSISKSAVDKGTSDLENAPQSTQQSNSSPIKVPVTKMMEYASPTANKSAAKSVLVSPPSKATKVNRQTLSRNSLSSLSDLVSRGVPEVKEKSAAKTVPQPESSSSSEEDDIQSGTDDGSDSDSDSDSSDDGSDTNFINAKSASKALGKKKTDSGFSSLIKDSKKI